jgi:predicted amidohydrolase
MKIAIYQVEQRERESAEERLERVSQEIQSQVDADLVILPEMWPLGFQKCDVSDEAVLWSEKVLDRLKGIPLRPGQLLHTGSFIEKEGDHYFNTCSVLDSEGRIVAKYRKIHLFSLQSMESQNFTAGKEVCVFEWDGYRVGLAICYDLRFPELFRTMADQDVDAIVIVAAWPQTRVDAWRLFSKSRALENQSFVFACNASGVDQGLVYGGHSMIVSPQGKVLAEAESSDEWLEWEVDFSTIEKIRRTFPFLKDRRKDLF